MSWARVSDRSRTSPTSVCSASSARARSPGAVGRVARPRGLRTVTRRAASSGSMSLIRCFVSLWSLPGAVTRSAIEPVPQLAGVAPADRQLLAGHHEVVAAAWPSPQLAHVTEGDEVPPVDPDETGVLPALLQGRDRHPDEKSAVVGVQADVVAAGLHEPDRVAFHHPRHAGDLHRDPGRVLPVGGRPPGGGREPADGVGQAIGADRLEQVVDRLQLEGLDGVLLEGGDEDDGRRRGEAGQHPGQLQPVEAGHADVEEHGREAAVAQTPQRLGGIGGGDDGADAGVLAEEVGEVFERRFLVVDDEYLQRRVDGRQEARTPLRYLGIRRLTLVPAPGAVSTTIPKSAPKTVRSRSSTLARPIPPLRPARLERTSCGSIPTPSSSTVMWASGPASVATMLMWP